MIVKYNVIMLTDISAIAPNRKSSMLVLAANQFGILKRTMIGGACDENPNK